MFGVVALALAGCATMSATTESVVSNADVPEGGYRKILVFVENDDADQLSGEGVIADALRGAGVQSNSSLVLFNYSRTRFSPEEKARTIVNQGFDAALYVEVVQKALLQEPVVGVTYTRNDAGWMLCRGTAVQLCYSMPDWYSVTPEGRLVKQALTLVTRSELQDVRSAKQVWAAQTSVSADGNDFGAISVLFKQVAKQISDKMRADRAI